MVKKENLELLKFEIDTFETLKNQLTKKTKQFEKETDPIRDKLNIISEKILKLKETITKEALTEYKELNQKQLSGGLGIRETKIYTYDENKAFNWAYDKRLCLTLDKKAFEKIAKVQPIDFVKEKIETKVTFPKQILLTD